MIDRPDVLERARRTMGTSEEPIYGMVRRALDARELRGRLVDVGCGIGRLRRHLGQGITGYTGVDVVRYDEFPADADFHAVNLDDGRVPLPDGVADVVVAVETIEHLENPRAFVRELVRLARPGGWVMISTPNQGSLLSMLTLVAKGHFVAFLDSSYPAHITALLETDLRRIAAENRLDRVAIEYSRDGRLPGTSRHAPRWLARLFPRLFSDNLLLAARKPID